MEKSLSGMYVNTRDNVCREIIKKLLLLLTRFGIRFVSSREIFWGPYVERLPNYVLKSVRVLSPVIMFNAKYFRHEIFGGHAFGGILSIIGKNIINIKTKEGDVITSIEPWDIVPTVLGLMNVPLPHDTDGKMLMKEGEVSKFNYTTLWRKLRMLRRTVKRTYYTY